MRQIQVVDRQNLIDIAVQYYGSAASVIDLCIDNGLELDTDLIPGQFLLIQDTYPDSADGDVADYLQGTSVVVTGLPPGTTLSGDYLVDVDGNYITDPDGNYITLSPDFFTTPSGDYIVTNVNEFIIT